MNPDLLLDITPEPEILSRINILKIHMEGAGVQALF